MSPHFGGKTKRSLAPHQAVQNSCAEKENYVFATKSRSNAMVFLRWCFISPHFLQLAAASGALIAVECNQCCTVLCLSHQLQNSAHKQMLKPFVCVRRRRQVTWVAPRLQLPWDWSRWQPPSAPPGTAALLLCSCSCCFSLEICGESESVNHARKRVRRKSHVPYSSTKKLHIEKCAGTPTGAQCISDQIKNWWTFN